VNKETWRKRVTQFKQALAERPRDGKLWLEWADFQHDECIDPEDTLEAYENAQQLLPDMDLRLSLGEALVYAGRVDEGFAMLHSYVEEYPRTDAYCILAHVLIQEERYGEARQALKAAIKIEPGFEEAYCLMGDAIRVESRREAARYYREALERDPQYQPAWRELGSALLFEEETLSEGIDALRVALSLNPEDGWTMAYLANGLWKAGDLEGAEAYYRKGMEAFPDFPQMREWYADFLRSQGRAGEAERLLSASGQKPDDE